MSIKVALFDNRHIKNIYTKERENLVYLLLKLQSMTIFIEQNSFITNFIVKF